MMSNHNIRRGFIYLFSQNSCSLCNPPRVSLSTISESLMLQKHHSLPQPPPRVHTGLTTLKTPQKSDTIFSFFTESGFSATHLEKMLRTWPQLLSMNLDKTIKPKIKILRDFGFSSDEIAEIISKDPWVLHSSADKKFIPSLSVLKGLLGSTEKVAKCVKASSWYLQNDLNKTLVPNIDFLTSCGVAMDRIFRLMYRLPRLLLLKPEQVEKYVEKAVQRGAVRNSGMFIHGVKLTSSMSDESWELKVKAFRDVGFSEHDILRAFRTAPGVFAISEEKMKKVKEVILATGKYRTSSIVNNPMLLNCSIEKRYKPRIEVLRILEEKNVIKKWPGFTVLFSATDKKFLRNLLIRITTEVGEVYLRMMSSSGKREVNSVQSPNKLDLCH